jgi:digeranylgeranylglycerophospholipid reductase
MLKNEYDIIVVGAGPAGTVAARYAAKYGAKVLVLEKDRDVGYPVRCAEAISKRNVVAFIEPDDKWINAKINKYAFISPDGNEVVVEFAEDNGYVIERRIFDYELGKLATEAGAQIQTRVYVHGLILEGDQVCGVKAEFQGEQLEIKSKIVIGADGVESRVGRWAGIKTHIDHRDMEACLQVTAANIDNIDPNTLYFYLGSNYAPGGYFWVFPKGDKIANIGLGVSGDTGKKRSALSYLNENMERFYPDASIMTQVAGGVPCALTLEKISGNGIMLVGDAARQVNPLTGGGIGSGMIGGKVAGEIAGEAITKGKLKLLDKYRDAWMKERGKSHLIFDRLKDGIFNLSDDEFNSIIQKLLKTPKQKRTLGRFFMTALAKKPRLIVDVLKVYGD